MSHFAKGDTVAWSHTVAVHHGTGSIARTSSVASQDPGARFGTVLRASKRFPNAYDVKFGKNDERTLTFEEIVKVVDE